MLSWYYTDSFCTHIINVLSALLFALFPIFCLRDQVNSSDACMDDTSLKAYAILPLRCV
jgi:hypothetical protein